MEIKIDKETMQIVASAFDKWVNTQAQLNASYVANGARLLDIVSLFAHKGMEVMDADMKRNEEKTNEKIKEL